MRLCQARKQLNRTSCKGSWTNGGRKTLGEKGSPARSRMHLATVPSNLRLLPPCQQLALAVTSPDLPVSHNPPAQQKIQP